MHLQLEVNKVNCTTVRERNIFSKENLPSWKSLPVSGLSVVTLTTQGGY
jgi:hypothetical protein